MARTTKSSSAEMRTPVEVAAAVRSIGESAKLGFIDRDDAVNAFTASIVAGEHMLLLGAPGTAKSSMVRHYADTMALKFFRRVLNPDTTREDLVGPIDPHALTERGVWDRKWAGLATCNFALLDEVGKASEQVLNMLLDAMEERRVTSGDEDRPIPLHCAVGASNEAIYDNEAIWDRFTVRLYVEPVSNARSFARMLTASAPRQHEPITVEELRSAAQAASEMAANPPQRVLDKLVEMWSEWSTISDSRVSDRRWRKVLQLAAGRALSQGRTEIAVRDLDVCRWMLWGKVDEIDAVWDWVTEKTEERDMLAEYVGVVAELEHESEQPDVSIKERGYIYYRAVRLMNSIQEDAVQDDAEWDSLIARVNALQETL